MLAPSLFRLVLVAALSCAAFVLPASGDEPAPRTISYALRHRTAAEIGTVFRPLIQGAEGTALQLDEARDRIVLTGPAWTHELLATVLQRMDGKRPAAAGGSRTARPTAQPTGQASARLAMPRQEGPKPAAAGLAAASPANNIPAAPTRRILALPAGRAAALRRTLVELFDRRLEASGDVSGAWSLATPPGPLQIEIDLAREDLLLDGPVPAVEQFTRLLATLTERPDGSLDRAARVLVVPGEVRAEVQAILQDSRRLPPAGTPRPFRLSAMQNPAAGEPPPAAGDQVPAGRGAAGRGPADTEETQAGEMAAAEGDPQSVLPDLSGIDVEALPELDALILRGRDKDIDELADLIKRLETLSQETQPASEVVGLQHAPAAQLAEIIEATQEDLLGARQGRAQVIPLGKPNALLLIGWGEAVDALKELIGKLDQPVRPQSQFQLYPLQHANAADVQETLEEFFADRPEGVGPTIQATVDQRTNAVIVHAAPRDIAEVTRLINRLDVPKSRMVQRTRIFPIRNSLAADVAETLEEAIATSDPDNGGRTMELLIEDETRRQVIVSGILEDIQITVNDRKNSLIIAAPAANFELIEAMIAQLDSAGTVAKIKIFPVQNGDAASLVETLRSLLPSQPATAGEPSVDAQLSSAPGETSLAPLRFTVDVRSNSIIASGSEGDLQIVEALVMRLDESDTMQRRTSVYQLKNSPAVDVALAINEFLRNQRQVESATPGATNPFDQLEKEVVVVPEPVSNKLVLSATPRYFEEIEGLIEKLDEQPPQVMIQVLIAEVTLGNTDEFGIELGIQDSVLFDRSLLGDLVTLTNSTQTSTPAGILTETEQVIVGASNDPGFNFNGESLGNSGSAQALANSGAPGGQGLSNFSVGRSNAELGFGGLVLSASSRNINVLLRALEENRRMQVLSRPQILTLDNQPAFIQVGQRVPRIVGSTINQIGQQNQVELENVGLILGVTPRISPEGNVVMEIDAEKSNIGPENEGIPVSISADGTVIRSPRVNVASAQATVSAADGETIILGGLITDDHEELHRKVPYLGDIPVLKHLFRFDSVSERRTELLIILTPHVIRSVEDAERMKQIETARMSWCAADVFDLHGAALYGEELPPLTAESEAEEIIYPHVDPRGESLQQAAPSSGGSSPSVLEPVEPPPGFELNQPEPVPPRQGAAANSVAPPAAFAVPEDRSRFGNNR